MQLCFGDPCKVISLTQSCHRLLTRRYRMPKRTCNGTTPSSSLRRSRRWEAGCKLSRMLPTRDEFCRLTARLLSSTFPVIGLILQAIDLLHVLCACEREGFRLSTADKSWQSRRFIAAPRSISGSAVRVMGLSSSRTQAA